MKNIDIKKMNAEERLSLAIAKANCYGRWILEEIAKERKYIIFDKDFKQWMKIAQNISTMKGNKLTFWDILRR